jgi:glycosyltransferase involved in cell wall biosynthesis
MPYNPVVSLLLVVRNERQYIERSLNSYLEQTYPKEFIEYIIVDGMSVDGTREYLQTRVDELKASGAKIKFLDNPRQILASGWNIGIKNSSGDIVCRIDGHSTLDKNYVEIGVRELLSSKDNHVVAVGGWILQVEEKGTSDILAKLLRSRFATGNSPFKKCPEKAFFSDTAVFALYRKEALLESGLFNEELKRNQDIVLHSQMLDSGLKFLTHPDMKAVYFVRGTVPKLLKKAFDDGTWIILSGCSFLRHKIPMYFVTYLIICGLVALIILLGISSFSKLFGLMFLPLTVYVLLSIYFSLKDGKSFNSLLLIPLFFVFHLAYGMGSIFGVLRLRFNRPFEN